jgi:hypothetical protein
MLATLVPVRKDRDTKAELNRRGQACKVLAGTGISRRVKKLLILFLPAIATRIDHYIARADAAINASFN